MAAADAHKALAARMLHLRAVLRLQAISHTESLANHAVTAARKALHAMHDKILATSAVRAIVRATAVKDRANVTTQVAARLHARMSVSRALMPT